MRWLALLLVLLQDPAPGDLLREAAAKMELGGDPVEQLEKAAAGFEKALGADPASAPALKGRAESQLRLAIIRGRKGQDPVKAFEGAVLDYTKALIQNPKDPEALCGRGEAVVAWISERRLRGEEVRSPELDAAIADFTRAIEIDPGRAAAWAGRGSARLHVGLIRFQQARVYDQNYALSAADLDQAVRLEPDRAWWRFVRGEARYLHGVHLGYRAVDARDAYRSAAEDYRAAEKLAPASLPLYKEHLEIAEHNAAAEPPKPGARPARHITWAKSFEAAKAEAKARNVPIWFYVSGGAG